MSKILQGKGRRRYCIALNCHVNSVEDRRSFYKLPNDVELRKKWIENLGLTDDSVIKNNRPSVCGRHFTADCIGKKKALSWAVPTLCLGKTEGIHQPVKKKYRQIRKCAIRNCVGVYSGRMHAFPRKPELRSKWMEICKLKDNRKHYFICRRHFRPSFVHRCKLLKNSYPELNLGLENYDPLQESDNSNSWEEDEEHEEVGEVSDEDQEDNSETEKQKDELILETNCNKCKGREVQSRLLEEQIKAVRLKITKLERSLHFDHEVKDDDDEYVSLLLK